MEAKDTVMKMDEIENLIRKKVIIGKPAAYFEDWLIDFERELTATAEAQAEISFKAGIKEVVDWIELVPPVDKLPEGNMKHYVISIEQWEAKLKEWGIDKEV